MRKFALWLALLGSATPGVAQLTGTRMNRNAHAAETVSHRDPQSAIRVTNQFAQCVARREDKSIRRALDLPLASPGQMQGIYKYIDQYDECLGNRSEDWTDLGTPPLLLAGGTAEYFVSSVFKNEDFAEVRAMNDEALAKSFAAPRTPLEDLGLCMVRRDPAHIRALLATKPTSGAEKAAASAMVADVGACVPKGQSLTLATPSLRAVVAYAAYRAASKTGVPGA